MISRDFVEQKVNQLVALFPTVRVRMQYDAFSYTYAIEVTPLSVYESAQFLDWQCDTFSEFAGCFPTECIYFISEESLSKLDNPEIVKYGVHYRNSDYTVNDVTPIAVSPFLSIYKIDNREFNSSEMHHYNFNLIPYSIPSTPIIEYSFAA